ncbi:DLW-39 family protein [Actinomycetospora flava]|uniref:DLW-39 family protein n=1 Tax=Actinomycetospora flava TaxID=3129232 RepID=A0ABU8MAU2_9PSEU
MKALVTLALVAGVAVVLRRQREQRPTKDVWREATTSA